MNNDCYLGCKYRCSRWGLKFQTVKWLRFQIWKLTNVQMKNDWTYEILK